MVQNRIMWLAAIAALIASEASSEVKILVRVVESSNQDVGVLSDLVAGAAGPYPTKPDGTLLLVLPECSDSVEITARPRSPNLCSERKICQEGEILFLVEEGCYFAKQVIDGQVDWLPYAANIADVLTGDVPEALESAEFEKLRSELYAAMYANNFSESAEAANSIAMVAFQVGEVDYAWEASIAALDSAFRAVGVEPFSDDAPLFSLTTVGTYSLTEVGRAAMLALDPGNEALQVERLDSPIFLTSEAMQTVDAFNRSSGSALHPKQLEFYPEHLQDGNE